MKFELPLEEGKYKVLYDEGNIIILRHGEPWRNETGDGFLHALLMTHIDLEMKLFEMKRHLEEDN